jgi:hypothetical protein
MGYGGALDRQQQLSEAEQMKKYREMQQQTMQMQIEEAKRRATQEQGQRDWRTGLPAVMNQKVYGAGEEGPTMAPDSSGLQNYLMQPNSPFADELLRQQILPKAPEYKTVGDNLLEIGRGGVKPVFTAPQKVDYNKPFLPDGTPNDAYQAFSLKDKKAGATNVTLPKIEVKMGESIAGQVGPMVKDTYTAANGAVQQIDAANRIVSAIDSGKVIAGPLANARLTMAQAGQMLGVTSGSEADRIAQTRAVIRGLSEMTLQGRKQMSGQGAITESEGKLAEKANSGDIADLTAAEIRQLAVASARASKFIYEQHQSMIDNLQQDPNTANLAKFYKVRPMPNVNFGETQNPTQSGVVDFRSLK